MRDFEVLRMIGTGGEGLWGDGTLGVGSEETGF